MKKVIGFDLCDDVSQISYSDIDDKQVITVSMVTGTAKYCFPTCMSKLKNVPEWKFGEEANRLRDTEPDAFRADMLLSRAVLGSEIEFGEEKFDPVELLSVFLNRTMHMYTRSFPWNEIACIIITVDELNARMVEVLRQATDKWDMKDCKVKFISHVESFFYYTVNQPEEMRKYKVALLDYNDNAIKASMLSTNRHVRPAVTLIDEKKYRFDKKDDEKLLDICRQFMDSEIVSSVYLSGDGFEGDWEKETIKYLCMKRRVFQGRNLYTKGACYAAIDMAEGSPLIDTELYLGKDKLKSNIGIDLITDGTENYHPIIDAGVNWFDCREHMDVMIGHDREIRIIITPISGTGRRVVVMRADNMPDRPERACRVRLDFTMKSDEIMECRITDMGFGEIFPATGNVMTEKINLSDKEAEQGL